MPGGLAATLFLSALTSSLLLQQPATAASLDSSNPGPDNTADQAATELDRILSDKRYMRFGRNTLEDGAGFDETSLDKRYMRFGKRPAEESQFILAGEAEDGDVGKRYMRFGRSYRHPDDVRYYLNKRYMRFGRTPDKRYMRFGRDVDMDIRLADDQKAHTEHRFGDPSESW